MIYSYNKSQQDALISQLYFGKELYMLRADLLSIIIIIIIIIIIFHGLDRLTCSGIDALPSFRCPSSGVLVLYSQQLVFVILSASEVEMVEQTANSQPN